MAPVKRAALGVLALAGVVLAAWALGLFDLLSWDALSTRRDELQAQVDTRPVAAIAVFFALYVAVTAASLPLAAPLTVAGGALFGFVEAMIAVSFASTLGATLATAASRWLFADLVRARFARAVAVMDEGLASDGVAWLLAVRLVPALPFFVVNLVLGLARVPLRTIFWTSQLGMLPGTAVYVWAGAELGLVAAPSDLISPRLWAAFVALAVLPFVSRRAVARWREHRVVVGGPGSR